MAAAVRRQQERRKQLAATKASLPWRALSVRSAFSAGSSSRRRLIGLFIGRWLDHKFGTGIFWSAPLLLLGVVIGSLVGLAMDAQAMTHFSLTGHDLIPYVIGCGAWLTARGSHRCVALPDAAMERSDAGGRPIARAGIGDSARAASRSSPALLAVVAVHFGAFPLLVAAVGVLAARTASFDSERNHDPIAARSRNAVHASDRFRSPNPSS